MMQEYKDDSKHKMKIHKHDVCEKAILDSNCCIPPPLMSVNVNVTINRPPLSFVHTSKYSSIIPAGFHEFVDRRFRSICKSIYSPGHAIRLLNVLRRLLHPHQHTHQKPTPTPTSPPTPLPTPALTSPPPSKPSPDSPPTSMPPLLFAHNIGSFREKESLM